jgi:predicted PurR-regulated permease PerM
VTGAAPAPLEPERRRRERRVNERVADLTIPEMRRLLVTTLLSSVVIVLFLYMVRRVIVAGILGVIIAVYVRPLYLRVLPLTRRRAPAALLTIFAVMVPVLAALAYSYAELSDLARYVDVNRDEIAAKVAEAIHRIPFMETANVGASIRAWVIATSDYGSRLPGLIRGALVGFSVAATIFVFTAFYILMDADVLGRWIRGKIPPRYAELRAALETSVRGVLYGAIYSTLLTQTLKSLVILALNLIFGIPLAAVLAIISFIVGFFPVVGSWSIYVPVALWLLVFRGETVPAIVMVLVGFLGNTLFISMYLRPKLAADRSRVLNFYWMLVALVTGVYTFGLPGILIGPILIGMLKAIIDTVSATTGWRVLDESDADESITGATA